MIRKLVRKERVDLGGSRKVKVWVRGLESYINRVIYRDAEGDYYVRWRGQYIEVENIYGLRVVEGWLSIQWY